LQHCRDDPIFSSRPHEEAMAGLALLMALIAVPIAEIAVLIEVGGAIGTAATIGAIVLTAIAGTALIRHQGLGVIADIRRGLEAGSPSLAPLIDGLFLLIAGAFMLTPGFITDAVGLALLVPPFRRTLARAAWLRIARRTHIVTGGGRPGGTRHDSGAGGEIEGRFVDLGTRPDAEGPESPSPWSPERRD
jgi:UPF0716 protein FxsA